MITMSDMQPLHRSRRQVKCAARLGRTVFEHLENANQKCIKNIGRRVKLDQGGFISYTPAS